MASIQTGIELNDQFTSVIYGIINAVNLTVSTMEDMQHTMNADMDTSGIEGVRDEINQATMAMQELNQAMQNQPLINTDPFVQPTTQSPAEPQRTPEWSHAPPGMDVFTSSGVERFQQEVQSANAMLEQLSTTQDAIAQQAYNTNLLPPEAFRDLNSLAVRIDTVRNRIQQIENNPLNVGTDTANAELEMLRSQLSQAVEEQNQLNQAMQNMDVSAANDAYLRLSQTVGNTERYIRDNVDEQGRFNQAINEGISQANDLMNTIKGVVGAYLSVQAVGDVLNISDELVQTTSRLNMMNDGLQSTEELVNMVYAAAQDARGSFDEMADVVARFGNNAGDAFSSSAEVVAFADLVQKQMTIAGASTTEASNAMLQLSQGLGSGVLRGDELNSIFEQAPNLIQSIADYLDVPIGKIREMAQDGQLTADIVKNAIFASADDINAKFEQMPMTWGQVWTIMGNAALMQMQPVLTKVNEIANNEDFQLFAANAVSAFATVVEWLLNILELASSIAAFISDNWSIIEPIVLGIATAMGIFTAALLIGKAIMFASAAATAIHTALTTTWTAATFAETAAQQGLNAALLACPITWIIIAIIAVIALIFAICSAIAKMTGVANSGFGVITGGINVAIQFFKNLGLTVANIALGIGNALSAVASNMMTAFHNAICSVQAWFYGLLSDVLTVIAGIAEALNKLPFVEFDYSGITNAANDYAAKAAEAEAEGNKEEYKSIGDAFNEGMSTFDTFQDGWASDAFASGAAWGDGVADKVSGMFDGGIDPSFLDSSNFAETAGNGISDTADNTGALANSLDITSEDLKYLRDIAETEAINRFTTAEIKVEMTNNNNVSGDMDLDGMVDYLANGVNEAMEKAAEGVHD